MKRFVRLFAGAFGVLAGALGCAVGSPENVTDDTSTTIPKVDAGGPPTMPVVPSEANFPSPTKDAGGGSKDASVLDSTTPVPPAPPASTGPCDFTGILATYDATSLTGSSAQLTSSSTAAGVTASPMVRTGVTAVAASGAFNATGWPKGGVDLTKHFTFTITPKAGCALDLTTVGIDVKSSSSGPVSASVATDVNAYASPKSFSATTGGGHADVAISASAVADAPIEVHVYGYGANQTSGTMRIDGAVTVRGTSH